MKLDRYYDDRYYWIRIHDVIVVRMKRMNCTLVTENQLFADWFKGRKYQIDYTVNDEGNTYEIRGYTPVSYDVVRNHLKIQQFKDNFENKLL